jgi:hypothetical protein
MELGEREKGKESDTATAICEGRRYKIVYWRILKNRGVGGKGVSENSILRDWTDQSKAHHRGHTLRHPSECQLKY